MTILSLLHIVSYLILSVIHEVETVFSLQMKKTEAQYAVLVAEPQCSHPRWSGSRVHILSCNSVLPLHSNREQWCVSVLSVYIVCIYIHTHTYIV